MLCSKGLCTSQLGKHIYTSSSYINLSECTLARGQPPRGLFWEKDTRWAGFCSLLPDPVSIHAQQFCRILGPSMSGPQAEVSKMALVARIAVSQK